MKIQSFSDIEKILGSKRPDINTVNWFFALEDMKKFMQELGNPQNQFKVIHIAGTSGKTSTAYYIAKMLELSGQKTGLTVSPHVDNINERVQVGGQPLSETEFVDMFEEFISLKAVRSMEITYFGLLVAFAYWVFAKKQVDYAVIEVGMGGALDATNVFSRTDKICIITDIGLDHTKFLGNSVAEIAEQKAGIIKPEQHVFVAEQDEQAMSVFKKSCVKNNATMHVLSNETIMNAPKFLPGFQKRNWSLAKSAFDFVAKRDGLDMSIDASSKSANLVVPARMEQFTLEDKTLIVDGSHNAQKITALVEAMKQKFPGEKVAAMISMVDGKESSLRDTLIALSEISDILIVAEFTSTQDVTRKAIKTNQIAEVARELGFKNVIETSEPGQAFEKLMSQPKKVVLVTGSFFLLNHVRPLINKNIN